MIVNKMHINKTVILCTFFVVFLLLLVLCVCVFLISLNVCRLVL